MHTVGVIPSRFGSTRFPGKPLVNIGGKPLLHWVIEGAKTSQRLDRIIVATDHQEIFDLAQSLDCEAVMTPSDLPSGSDRVWAAIADLDCEVVVNIQGDEPSIEGKILDRLIDSFSDDVDSKIDMTTLGRPFKNTDELRSLATAKIILSKDNFALYFSRAPIPHTRENGDVPDFSCLKHIGVYAYRKSFLKKFCESQPVPIEMCEGLEQLRALYLGAHIKVVEVDTDSWGVDYPEDVERIEKLLKIRENSTRGN